MWRIYLYRFNGWKRISYLYSGSRSSPFIKNVEMNVYIYSETTDAIKEFEWINQWMFLNIYCLINEHNKTPFYYKISFYCFLEETLSSSDEPCCPDTYTYRY